MTHCLLQSFSYYFIICRLRTVLKGREARHKRLPGPLHKAQQEVGLVGASEILMDCP